MLPALQLIGVYAWNVRHQPVYLSQSKCMQNSGGALSCLTCHEPYQPLQKSSAYYNERCQSCHAEVHRGERWRNCVDCHMLRVSPQTVGMLKCSAC